MKTLQKVLLYAQLEKEQPKKRNAYIGRNNQTFTKQPKIEKTAFDTCDSIRKIVFSHMRRGHVLCQFDVCSATCLYGGEEKQTNLFFEVMFPKFVTIRIRYGCINNH